MKRNGHTKAGTVRWRCKACNASTTCHYESGTKDFELFLQWLYGKHPQGEIAEDSRGFRRRIKRYWDYWALPPIHEVTKVMPSDNEIAVICKRRRRMRETLKNFRNGVM